MNACVACVLVRAQQSLRKTTCVAATRSLSSTVVFAYASSVVFLTARYLPVDGTARPKFCSVRPATPRAWTCGALVAFSARCSAAVPCSRYICTLTTDSLRFLHPQTRFAFYTHLCIVSHACTARILASLVSHTLTRIEELIYRFKATHLPPQARST